MSCTICHGHPGCPVCAPDTKKRPCPVCLATGITAYFNTDGDEITSKAWESLPEKEREQDACEVCDGTGEIEYEPEYQYSEL